HAGIATQMVVERELAKNNEPTRSELGREVFLEKVWAWKEKSGGTIINQLKRLGASCDYSRTAFTMAGAHGDTRTGHENSTNFHDAVLKTFVDFYNKGLIYKGKRLVNWDPHFETAISDLEVENIEVDGHMWHFKYPLVGDETYTYIEKDEDGNIVLSEERNYISIATTRPETMLGDGAVAVFTNDERYAPIVGKSVHLPLCNRTIPVIVDEYPDPDFGSGAVKITGAHDFNDYQVAKRNKIPMYSLMDTKGAMRSDDLEDNFVPQKYQGMDRFEARKAVVADINELGLMIKVEDKKVMQPFGDRSKVVIEPALTDQWFVDTAQIVQPAIDAVKNGTTKILPEGDKKVYFHWLENIEPWCISRQLWWGHQVPVWNDHDGNAFCAMSEEEAIKQALEKYQSEYPNDDIKIIVTDNLNQNDTQDNIEKNIRTVHLSRDSDVLDTWFSSGLWPFGTLGWPENSKELERYYTSDNLNRTLITGFDIIFFWVARMMMMGIETMGKVPFETVYVHPLVRDEHGKKMSKSTGNVMDPLDLIDKYGADAVRFTLTAMAAMGRDLKLSENRIEGYRNFGTKLWNATRFAEFNNASPNGEFNPKLVKQTLNKWIIGETALVREAVDNSLEQYRFNDAANSLYVFVWNKVCDWYVELSKPLLQGDDLTIAEETKETLAWVLDQSYILLHPIMPFITENLWSETGSREKLLAHAEWPIYTSNEYVSDIANKEMNWVISLIEQIRSVRSEMRINAGLKIPMIQMSLDDVAQKALDSNKPMIMRLARIDNISIAAEAPNGAITLPVEGGQFCLPLADIINVDAEKSRLNKAIEKLEKELNSISQKLSNDKFILNAPEAVILENRNRIEIGGEELLALQAALSRVMALA
ncbi:valine--tRNA ligase, partial [Amylibacter sp.]|nr:valine--tRNA ligase [Amylibacter sp.]